MPASGSSLCDWLAASNQAAFPHPESSPLPESRRQLLGAAPLCVVWSDCSATRSRPQLARSCLPDGLAVSTCPSLRDRSCRTCVVLRALPATCPSSDSRRVQSPDCCGCAPSTNASSVPAPVALRAHRLL